MLSLLRLECKQKNSSNPFRIRIFLFLSYSFGIETINTFIHSVVPSKTIPDVRPNAQRVYLFSDQNGAKTYLMRAAHTHLYGLYKGEPPPPRDPGFQVTGPDGDDRRIFSSLNFLFRDFFGCPRIPAA